MSYKLLYCRALLGVYTGCVCDVCTVYIYIYTYIKAVYALYTHVKIIYREIILSLKSHFPNVIFNLCVFEIIFCT